MREWLDVQGWHSDIALPDDYAFLVMFMDNADRDAYNDDAGVLFSYSVIRHALTHFEVVLDGYGE